MQCLPEHFTLNGYGDHSTDKPFILLIILTVIIIFIIIFVIVLLRSHMISNVVPYITDPISDFPEGRWADWAFVTKISKIKRF